MTAAALLRGGDRRLNAAVAGLSLRPLAPAAPIGRRGPGTRASGAIGHLGPEPYELL